MYLPGVFLDRDDDITMLITINADASRSGCSIHNIWFPRRLVFIDTANYMSDRTNHNRIITRQETL